jgi:hypothetical protein
MIQTYKPESPQLVRQSRVQFVRKHHPRDGQYCTILDPLPNPSHLAINQWYDVKFDDGRYLRCHVRDLQALQQ